jgi:hypothetical protein
VEWVSQRQAELAENWSLARRQQPIQPLEYGMLKDVVAVQPTQDYCLHLRFEDGLEGEVDVAVLIQFEGIFAP